MTTNTNSTDRPTSDPTERLVSRRTWIGAASAGAVGLGALALAGCSSGSSGSSGGSSTASSAAGTTAPTTPASEPATSSAAAASSPSSAASSAASTAEAAVVVATLSDVPVGGSIAVTISGKPALLSQPTAGTVKAFSSVCTHQGCPVKPAGALFKCPCHGSVYNAFTGAVEQGPAPSPLPAIAVTVSGSSVVAG